jgi:hypothetical protein
MSLAITAAPFNTDRENYNMNDNDTPVNRKRQANTNHHNKTQKRNSIQSFDPQKVNNVLESLHNRLPNEDETDMGDYNPKKNRAPVNYTEEYKPLNPLQPPTSMRKDDNYEEENNSSKEGMANNSSLIPQPMENDEFELKNLSNAFMNDTEVKKYYKNLVPNYQNKNNKTENNKNYYTESQYNFSSNNSDLNNNSNQEILINKLNYMINLLEEQQDEKTNNVTEEVVLYSFLGIFIIFVVDSFARVGKYVR